jgi:hypothetical protein
MGGEKNRGKGEGMEGERREEKGREGMDAPGAGPPKIFGLEPPLSGWKSLSAPNRAPCIHSCDEQSALHTHTTNMRNVTDGYAKGLARPVTTFNVFDIERWPARQVSSRYSRRVVVVYT